MKSAATFGSTPGAKTASRRDLSARKSANSSEVCGMVGAVIPWSLLLTSDARRLREPRPFAFVITELITGIGDDRIVVEREFRDQALSARDRTRAHGRRTRAQRAHDRVRHAQMRGVRLAERVRADLGGILHALYLVYLTRVGRLP